MEILFFLGVLWKIFLFEFLWSSLLECHGIFFFVLGSWAISLLEFSVFFLLRFGEFSFEVWGVFLLEFSVFFLLKLGEFSSFEV